MITTITEARGMHIADLRRRDDDIAREQVRLREEGGALVRGALASLGHRYSGTGGWHIIPMMSPEKLLGFVDSARGVAVLTDVELDAATVEALTVPDQPEGPQASGAAAWAGGDPGEAHSASAPTGWVQLVVDIRDYQPIAEGVRCRGTVVGWGLRTCYRRLGRPGHMSLDGDFTPDADDARRWADLVTGDTRRAVEEVGHGWLRRVALGLARDLGREDEVSRDLAAWDARDATAWERVIKWRPRVPTYSPAAAVERAIERAVNSASRDALVYRIDTLCRDPRHQAAIRPALVKSLLHEWLRPKLTPHADLLCDQLVLPEDRDASSDERHQTSWYDVTVRDAPPVLEHLAKAMLGRWCRDTEAEARAVEDAMWGTLYLLHGGPVNPNAPVAKR